MPVQVVVASVDADAERDLGSRYGVTGFPTLKFFPRGEDKEAQDYNGGREAADLISFLNENAGTKRVLGGGLSEDAARLPGFDALAKKFVSAYVPGH